MTTAWRTNDEREWQSVAVDRRRQVSRIVLAGMPPHVEVSDLCRREGLNPVQLYF